VVKITRDAIDDASHRIESRTHERTNERTKWRAARMYIVYT